MNAGQQRRPGAASDGHGLGVQLGRRHPPGRPCARRSGPVRRRVDRARGGRPGRRKRRLGAEERHPRTAGGALLREAAEAACASQSSAASRTEKGRSRCELRGTTALIVIDMQNGFCDGSGFMNKIGLDYDDERGGSRADRRLLDAAAGGRPAGLLHSLFAERRLLRRRPAARGLPGDQEGRQRDRARLLGRGGRRRARSRARTRS